MDMRNIPIGISGSKINNQNNDAGFNVSCTEKKYGTFYFLQEASLFGKQLICTLQEELHIACLLHGRLTPNTEALDSSGGMCVDSLLLHLCVYIVTYISK